MRLNRKEKRILQGENGSIKAKALKLLVEIGEQKGAEELVDIRRSHISGVSYKTAGKPMLQLLEDMVEQGVKVKTFATVNPAGMPRKEWKTIGVPEEFALSQHRIIAAYQKLGCEVTLSCTPYSRNPPKKGDTVAFAESSAVCYVNSVIGARTNRHGSLDALAASITGKVPKMGLLLDEKRKPRVLIKVNFIPASQTEFSLLGLFIGRKLEKEDNPAFSLSNVPTDDELKSLGGGLATSGAIALFHVLGVTPEAQNLTKKELRSLETITVTEEELKEFSNERKQITEKPDLIAFGCPHVSLNRLKAISKKLAGRKVRNAISLWIFTSEAVISRADESLLKPIRHAGGRLIIDTCPVVAPIEKMGIKKVVVDSGKACSYIPRLAKGVTASISNLDEIVEKWTVKC